MKKNICVFCGSRPGANPDWSTWATQLGSEIAKMGHSLTFGGGAKGLMGNLANGAIDAGGEVIGIIPEQLEKIEGLVEHLTLVHYVKNMSARKELMDQFAEIYVVLPGGIGTMDEFFEVWTTAQVGYHHKPIILVNWSGYYDHLILFLKESAKNGMISDSHFEKILCVESLAELTQTLQELSK
jgi:uncharacterized protein (TIGR00730 family)